MYTTNKRFKPAKEEAAPELSAEERAAQAFVKEVDDALHEETLSKIWQEWRVAILSTIVGLFALAVGVTWWKQHTAEMHQAEADALYAAVSGEEVNIEALNDLATGASSAGVQILAVRMEASALVDQGKYEEAEQVLQTALNTLSLNPEMHAVLQFHLANVQAETSVGAAMQTLSQLDRDGNPVRGNALELQALLSQLTGDNATALALYEKIRSLQTLPAGLRARAEEQIAEIEAGANLK